MEDVYGPIRSSIEKILGPTETEETSSNKEDNNKTVDENEDTAGYYKLLHRENDDENTAESEVGEKFLLSEIEKFRLRQLERDKYVLFIIRLL